MLTSNETGSDEECAGSPGEPLPARELREYDPVRQVVRGTAGKDEPEPDALETDGTWHAGWTRERMPGRNMDARTKNGESTRAGPRAERWRPAPWEVISLMFTMVMVGAVVGGLTLAAFGEVREDIRSVRNDLRALGTRVTAVEHHVAAVEREVAKIVGWIEGFREAMEVHPPASG